MIYFAGSNNKFAFIIYTNDCNAFIDSKINDDNQVTNDFTKNVSTISHILKQSSPFVCQLPKRITKILSIILG
jgi:hypothetical protein